LYCLIRGVSAVSVVFKICCSFQENDAKLHLVVRKLQNIELNRLSVEDFRQSVKIPVVLVLDNVRSALNTGSIFRTADAFAIEALYLCGITAKPPGNELRKTALGAEESVTWYAYADTVMALEELRQKGYTLIAAEQTDKSILLQHIKPDPSKKYAIILGNEVNGVSEAALALCDNCVEIPQAGSKHSLNVSVSAGIVAWHFFEQLHK
jgi:tRNA G18 (ribose-2'-O)-methylase SpoU